MGLTENSPVLSFLAFFRVDRGNPWVGPYDIFQVVGYSSHQHFQAGMAGHVVITFLPAMTIYTIVKNWQPENCT
jgi:hypothetical protein